MYPIEDIPDKDTLNRWAYDPAVSEPLPTKGLKFISDPPHNNCESFNWEKYLNAPDTIHEGGLTKAKSNQKYLGYYIANIKIARTVHKGKAYENDIWFEVTHTPKDDNQAHTDIKIIKQSPKKALAKQAKIDLAAEALSDLIENNAHP